MEQRGHSPLAARWIPAASVLVVTTLLLSVVIPGIESADVLTALREDSELIAPARLASEQIESGIARAYTELHRYVVFRDTASPGRLKRITAQNEGNIAKLRQLTDQLRDGDSVVKDVKVLATRMQRFHALTTAEADELRPAESVEALGRRTAARDSVLTATAQIQSDLARLVAEHRSAVVVHERRGLLVNAGLVLAALLALVSMLAATQRERRRAHRDLALRIAAEALAEAFSTADIARQIAQSAIEVSNGRSAVMLTIDTIAGDSPRMVVSARAGESDALGGFAGPYRGSIVERAIGSGRPNVHDVQIDDRTLRLLVIPLGTTDSPNGAVLVALPPGRRLRPVDHELGATFGHLAQLAYEKLRLLEDARAARSQLERVMESRNRLMRGFSHDVKNPLGAADGYAALIEDEIYGPMTDGQRRGIGRLRRAIRRALSLIDDLHRLARVESGEIPVHFERIDVTQLMLDLGDEYRATADARKLELVVDIDADLPMVVTDASRVRQIVANLLSNAIKYTDTGSVTLRVHHQPGVDPHAQRILIRVADTGPGIPPDKLVSIFEEFTRLSDRQPGAGVGLAISKHLANAIGCSLDVASEVGKGSTFTLAVPLNVERGEPATATHGAEPPRTPVGPLTSDA